MSERSCKRLFFVIFRRAHLRDCLVSLRELVPATSDGSKVTTLSLLQSAKQYIKVIIVLPKFLNIGS